MSDAALFAESLIVPHVLDDEFLLRPLDPNYLAKAEDHGQDVVEVMGDAPASLPTASIF